MMISFRNAVRLADGRINCEIEHPSFGWIPFTADANDVEPHGREIHAAVLETNPPAATEEPPLPAPVPQVVSRFQALAALHLKELLGLATAEATKAGGIVKLAFDNAQEFRRDSQAIAQLAPAIGLTTDEQIDELFRLAATITA